MAPLLALAIVTDQIVLIQSAHQHQLYRRDFHTTTTVQCISNTFVVKAQVAQAATPAATVVRFAAEMVTI